MKAATAASEACDDLSRIVEAIEIRDADEFSIGGIACAVEDSVRQRKHGHLESSCTTPLATALSEELYERLFTCQGGLDYRAPDGDASRRFGQMLSEANTGTGTWEPGWRLVHEGTKSARVKRRGVTFRVPANEFRAREETLERHEEGRVLVPPEFFALSPGYYIAVGDADAAPASERPYLVRLYWSLTAEVAPAWIRGLTQCLNGAGTPFRLKALTDPRYYRRADAGVLYLEPRHYEASAKAVRQVYDEVEGGLGSEAPPLTLALAPGVGVAEGPADGASYGLDRCQLIANSLVSLWENGGTARAGWTDAVANAFRLAGLDPARPHLAPGSKSAYASLVSRPHAGTNSSLPAAASATDFAEAAREIGDTLCDQAIWHDGRCTWMGHPHDERRQGRKRDGLAVVACGSDLHSGSAGVGLFLARLHAAGGSEAHRRTSVAALRQALAPAAQATDEVEEPAPLGFYDGGLGVCWAALEVGRLTGEGEISASGEALLDQLLLPATEPRFLDLMRGAAGSVLALLDLDSRFPGLLLKERAWTLGGGIVQSAVADGASVSWPNRLVSGIATDDPALMGLSHGVAGIALALLELWAVSDDRSFLTAARAAFAYEDSLFDVESKNWPDLRGVNARIQDGGRRSVFSAGWCHGAPGITLARLRAMSLDPEESRAHEERARVALETTLRLLEERLVDAEADTSLCHGLCGLIEVARTAGRTFGERRLEELARDGMRVLVERHRDGSWPSGALSRGSNPSLMLGLAGVGHTLLQLNHGQTQSSILLISLDGRREAAGHRTGGRPSRSAS